MTGHRPTPRTIKLRVSLEPTTEQSFITEVKKKHCLVSIFRIHGDKDYRVSWKKVLCTYLPKKCSFWTAETLAKT